MSPSARPVRRTIDDATRLRLADCAREGVCPSCGQPLDALRRVGTGAVEDGYFCSMDCLAQQHYAPRGYQP